MIRVNINEAKTHLSQYLARLPVGETLLICKRNVPVAEMQAVRSARKKQRPIGLAKGQIKIHPSFFDPLPAEWEALFEGQDAEQK